MRRSLVAVLAALTVLVAIGTAAVAVTLVGGTGTAGMHGMMGTTASRHPGWDHGPRGWMHETAVDSEFVYLTEMVAHHQEAVAAAEELRRSSRPQMRAFGRSIVESQSAQIDQMKGWLAEWYPGRSTEVDYRPMMRDLSGLSGDRLDRAFLQDMVPHQMMAVMMSQQLLVRDLADHAEVADLAETIRDVQHDEIFLMQRWLHDWFGAGWSHGGRGSGMGPGMMW